MVEEDQTKGSCQMVEHIVLFKLKPEVTDSQKEAFLAALKGLKGRTPGMIDLSAGETFTDRHNGYTIGLVVRFENRESLEIYGPHPEHVPVTEMAKELCESVMAVDYEF